MIRPANENQGFGQSSHGCTVDRCLAHSSSPRDASPKAQPPIIGIHSIFYRRGPLPRPAPPNRIRMFSKRQNIPEADVVTGLRRTLRLQRILTAFAPGELAPSRPDGFLGAEK